MQDSGQIKCGTDTGTCYSADLGWSIGQVILPEHEVSARIEINREIVSPALLP